MKKFFVSLLVCSGILFSLFAKEIKDPLKFYYFNSFHWDRAWYQTFEEYRKYLANTADLLIENFKSDEFKMFTLDGQTIVLEDICQLRPSLRPKLQELVSAKKLNVGPWYTMPDEILPQAESMMRNLAIGTQVARDFGGEPWKVGYMCDIFGHAAQTPQIFDGFGLEGTVVWRGFPAHLGPRMFWESPDGSRIKTLLLYPPRGYSDFNCDVRGKWNLPINEKTFKEEFRKYIASRKWFYGDCYALSDTADHTEPCSELGNVFRWMKEVCPNSTIIHSDLTDFFRDEYKGNLPVVRGEQINPATDKGPNICIYGVHVSRPDIKFVDDSAQNRLILGTEPQLAWRGVIENKQETETLTYLWKRLLECHSHDEICGCSIDAVHDEALGRYRKVEELAGILDVDMRNFDLQRLTGKNIREMVFNSPGPTGGDYHKMHYDLSGNYYLRIFNPLPFEINDVRELTLDYNETGDVPGKIRLLDESGKEIPYRLKSSQKGFRKIFYRAYKPLYTRKVVLAKVKLRPTGWTTVRVEKAGNKDIVRYLQSMRCGRMAAENEFLRLDINNDGTFSVLDKRTGIRRNNFNNYRITRDAGDGWSYRKMLGSAETLSSNRAIVKLSVDAPDRTEFEIYRYYLMPQKVVWAGNVNGSFSQVVESDEMVELCIKTSVSIDSGSDSLNVRTVIDNNLMDYRLQLEVPTDISGNYFTSQLGAIIDRAPGMPPEHKHSNDPEYHEKNFDGIIGKHNDKGGVAVLSRAGLHEAGVAKEDDSVICITLLRAFYKTYGTNGELGAQVQKKFTWDYRLKFFLPEVTNIAMFNELQKLRAPLVSYLVPQDKVVNLNTEKSFVCASGNLAFSAMKPSFDGKARVVVLRFFNPSDKTATETIRFDRKFVKASICKLDETGDKEIAADSDKLEISAGAWKFVTVKVQF